MLPIIYHPNYSCPFPEDHRFVMSKFVRLYDHVRKLELFEKDNNNWFIPETASLDDLAIAHDIHYLTKLCSNDVDKKEWRRIGLPWSEKLVERTLTAPNGTLLTAQKALETGLACHLAGGTHHAHYDFGSGFCILNDLAYAAKSLLREGAVNKILIFDLDVHQGDGTASILQNEERAFTCSIHCEKNFPFRKSQSDLDIGLDLYLEDDDYLAIVIETLNNLLDQEKPDLVLYDAGADVWQQDSLGKLNVSWQGLHDRDEQVIKTCLARHIPVATVIGGGYDQDHERLARRHGIVVETAAHLYHQYL